ncbi:hypothetical protein CLU79DRAFT_725718 [Phycomyces nitens]|nr:hypothetical protein CLU79DRAFT_725718 [Phycomyces nitens]
MSSWSRALHHTITNCQVKNCFTLWIIFSAFFLGCTGAPFDSEKYITEKEIAIVSILKTVFIAYLAHANTVRPDQSTLALPTIYKQMSAIAWPVSGIHEAVGSMIKAWRADKIIGIGKFKLEKFVVEPPLERYPKDKETVDKDEEGSLLGTGVNQIRSGMSILRTNLDSAQTTIEPGTMSAFDSAFKIMDDNLAEIDLWRKANKTVPDSQSICKDSADYIQLPMPSNISKDSNGSEKHLVQHIENAPTDNRSDTGNSLAVDDPSSPIVKPRLIKSVDSNAQFRAYLRKKSSQMYNRIAHDNGAYNKYGDHRTWSTVQVPDASPSSHNTLPTYGYVGSTKDCWKPGRHFLYIKDYICSSITLLNWWHSVFVARRKIIWEPIATTWPKRPRIPSRVP